MKKIVVVHFGKQHVFRLIKSLSETNLYEITFITTSYYKIFSLYWFLDKLSFGFLHRVISRIKLTDFPDNNVLLFNQFSSLILAFLVRIDKEKRIYSLIYRAVYKKFVGKVVRAISRFQPDIVIYYDANHLANQLKLLYPKILLVQDVAMASYRKTKEIERVYLNKSPMFKALLVDEDRYLSSTDNDVIDSGIMQTDYFIVGSDFVKESLEHYAIKDNKVFTVNYGVESNFEYAEKVFLFPHNIVFIGRAVQRKGIAYFVEAIKSFEDRDLINPIIIGDSKLLVKSNLFDLSGILLKGHLERSELLGILKHSTFLLNPTLTEGMSLAILEAMSYGVIPITTENSGYSNIIINGNNGFIIEPDDYQTIHKIINCVIKDSELMMRLSYNAYITSKSLTWEKYSQGIQNCISSICNSDIK